MRNTPAANSQTAAPNVCGARSDTTVSDSASAVRRKQPNSQRERFVVVCMDNPEANDLTTCEEFDRCADAIARAEQLMNDWQEPMPLVSVWADRRFCLFDSMHSGFEPSSHKYIGPGAIGRYVVETPEDRCQRDGEIVFTLAAA